jgi:RNA polymerase sigma-70 factor (ECF subfamily)
MTVSNQTERFIPTRSSLLARLKDMDDREGWIDFFKTYGKLIYDVARKAGLNDTEAQEVVQETVISVARNIPEFRYDPAVCSFKTWLLQAIRWRILDERRRCQREDRRRAEPAGGQTGESSLEQVPDPLAGQVDEILEEEWKKNLLELGLARLKERVRPIQYQIFDLLVFQNWPVAEIRRKLRVNAAQVYVTKYRLSNLLRKEVQRLEAEGK